MQLKSSANYSQFAQAVPEIQALEIFHLLLTIASHWNSSYPTFPTVAPVLDRVFAYFKYTFQLVFNYLQFFSCGLLKFV